mmetsp:Transcript_8266/g.14657  ORF Transcript_8266/g.14657 Transcript_8266/m.14657 type:complete len:174 (-) Transcript_8266:292-813(-)|eukprot:CAMPEP_0197680742 /NCGR_PEP_ID=MMETSP1338-20131121/93808_1 /TAXON_ID=43686 ORGANISM="Pelagodinium beii, Strain RCC1491" /NCGR_SAMPLE_ID=MMETSP1338 /ASSEMBLY_ACC=CAM_ASM_000754 /LENGTH=173 /DNA_ID=CAMNT_0043261971 /DNA_START=32 /DNA_END=553 /DNA_ORIENTATION=-
MASEAVQLVLEDGNVLGEGGACCCPCPPPCCYCIASETIVGAPDTEYDKNHHKVKPLIVRYDSAEHTLTAESGRLLSAKALNENSPVSTMSCGFAPCLITNKFWELTPEGHIAPLGHPELVVGTGTRIERHLVDGFYIAVLVPKQSSSALIFPAVRQIAQVPLQQDMILGAHS